MCIEINEMKYWKKKTKQVVYKPNELILKLIMQCEQRE